MNLSELLRLKQQLTQGPWQVEIEKDGIYVAVVDNGPVVAHCGAVDDERAYHNALFIVRCHNALEAVMDIVIQANKDIVEAVSSISAQGE